MRMSIDETMADQPQVALSPPRKRSFEEDDLPPVSTPKRAAIASDSESPLSVLSTIASPSPFKHASFRTSAPASSTNSVAGDLLASTQPAPVSSGTQQPAKRRKLTVQEKESRDKARAEKKAQKEAEEKAKAEQKAQKEEDKRLKDEERRKKNEEKEEKKRAKELDQQQKEEEKRKKERSQMRLNAFFVKPKPQGNGSAKAMVDSNQSPTPEIISLSPAVPIPDANPGPRSPQKTLQQKAKTDYDRYFLPFSLPSHALLAPYNRHMEDPAKLALARSRLEQLLSQEDAAMDTIELASVKSKFPAYKRRGSKAIPLMDVVERINSASDKPIDLTKDVGGTAQDPLQLLKQIAMKYLHFPEDVRPPYYGTYTKPHTMQEAARLARNPFSRTLREADYDYDSEAEWEEPEEGEDLDSEGEEDLDEEGDEDMDGFLDDEEDAQIKRRLISGDLQPVTTGLCWEDSSGVSKLNDGSGAVSTEFKGFGMGFLLEPYPQSIDPFSTAYWVPDTTSVPITFSKPSKDATITSMMQPPRMPLTQRPANNMLNTLNSTPISTSLGVKAAKPPKRLIPHEHLAAFKSEVEGSDLTKIALIEALKKKFPKLPKDAIGNTLSAIAARVGPKEVEKRWVLL